MNRRLSSVSASGANTSGFSLVELMITLLLGSLVVLAATRLLLTNQQAFALQQSQSEAQESGRFALEYLLADARRQGVKDTGTTTALLPSGTNDNTGTGRGGMGGFGTDSVTVTYIDTTDAATALDCEGNDVGASRLVRNTYFVDSYTDAAGGTLRCDGNSDSNTAGAEIITGVDSFHVLFGVDTNSNDVPMPTRYVTANNVGTSPVVAIRMALLLRSATRVEGVHSGIGYRLLDTTIPDTSVLDDQRLRRVFMGTAYIRNIPEGV